MPVAIGTAGVQFAADTDLPRHLARSLNRRWRRWRKAFKRCRRSFSEPAVHDARIETRRLLASLELLDALLPPKHLKRARRRLKRRLRAFAELRDTQVQLALTRRLQPRLPGANQLEAALLKRERRCRKQARKRIQRFDNDALAEALQALHRQLGRLDDPAARAATLKAVRQAFAETLRRRQQIQPEDTRTLHRTRLAFKHFRYMVESLDGVVRGVNRTLLRRLRAYQTLLGEIQDHEVFQLALQQLACDGDLSSDSAAVWQAEIDRQKRRLIGRFLKRADALGSFWPPPAPRTAVRGRRRPQPRGGL